MIQLRPCPTASSTTRRVALLGAALLVACSSSAPYGPRAAQYGHAEPAAALDALEADAVSQLSSELGRRNSPAPVPDARLRRAALVLNHWDAQEPDRPTCDPPASAEEAALDWAGVYERPVCRRCLWSAKDQVTIPKAVLQGLAACLGGPEPALVGVSTLQVKDRTYVTLLGVQRTVTLEPTERTNPSGQARTLRGVADPSAWPLTALVQRPRRPVEALPLPPASGGILEVPLPALRPREELALSVVRGERPGPEDEVVRIRLEGGAGSSAGTAWTSPREREETPDASRARLLAGLKELRLAHGLGTPQEGALLMSTAQDAANGATHVERWPLEPLSDPQQRALESVGTDQAVHKFVGQDVEDVLGQVRRSPLVLWHLTRADPLSWGLGLAVVKEGAQQRVAVVLLLSLPLANAFVLGPG